MVKHTQTIRRQQLTHCLSVFGHFVGLTLKGLSISQKQTVIKFIEKKTAKSPTVTKFSGPTQNQKLWSKVLKGCTLSPNSGFFFQFQKNFQVFIIYFTRAYSFTSCPCNSLHLLTSWSDLNAVRVEFIETLFFTSTFNLLASSQGLCLWEKAVCEN